MLHLLEERALVLETSSERVDGSIGTDVTEREHGTVAIEERELGVDELIP